MTQRGSRRAVRWRNSALLAALVTAYVAPQCSNGDPGDSACGASGSGTGIDLKAQMEIVDAAGPAQALYAFDALALGSTVRTFPMTIRNIAGVNSARPLGVVAVRLIETDASGQAVGQPAFTCVNGNGVACDKAVWPALVPSGFNTACAPAGSLNSLSVVVQFDPALAGGAGRKARLEIEFDDGDPLWADTPWTARFEANQGQAALKCGVAILDFGNLGAGKGAKEIFKCTAVGSAAVVLQRVELVSSTGAPIQVRFGGVKVDVQTPYTGQPPLSIGKGESLEFEAELAPLPAADKIGATLRLVSNSSGGDVTVQMLANSTGPCLKVLPIAIDFGATGVGLPKTQEVQLQGCGTEPVAVVRIGLAAGTSPEFQLDFGTASFVDGAPPSKTTPLTVQPNATESFVVRFVPASLGSAPKGAIEIEDTKGEIRILQVSGKAEAISCPVACIDPPKPGASVAPQTKISLTATCSTASPGHTVSKWEWTLSQPAGSLAPLLPTPKSKAVNFLPNVAGTYTATLTVQDDTGAASCTPVKQVIQVLPENKVHIELTWVTPGDPDPTDDKGSDLDLHLAHPDAPNVPGQKDLDGNGKPDPWNAQCNDCFWINKNPNWDDQSDADDNPNVDLDDTNGLGPENISIAWPQEGHKYWIGVYAWDDGGFGASTPRVRIYLDKVLVFDKKGPSMAKGDMWCAGRVLWNSQSVNPSKDIEACPGADTAGNLLTPKYPPASPTASWTCPPPG